MLVELIEDYGSEYLRDPLQRSEFADLAYEQQRSRLPASAQQALGQLETLVKDETAFHEAVGCEWCGGSGYRGRIGVYEIMLVDEELRRLILQGVSADEMGRAAKKAGIISLREDGLVKAARGITTVEEILLTII